MIIRSTTFSRLNRVTAESARIGREIDSLQSKVTSGLEVERPSDSPERVGSIQGFKAAIADYERWGKAADNAANHLSVADNALSDLAAVATKAWELAVQMGNDSYNADDRTSSGVLAESLIEDARQLLNSEINGRHLFAGTAYDAEPFAADLSYAGSDEVSAIDVSDDVQVTVGFDGQELGLDEVLTSIRSLQTALEANDVDAVRASIDEITSAMERISAAQTEVGSQQALALDFKDLSSSMGLEMEGHLSSLRDSDPVESIVRLTTMQQQYDIALQVTAKSRLTSLFERI